MTTICPNCKHERPSLVDGVCMYCREKISEGELRAAADYELEIADWKERLGALCDRAWGIVYPGKTDWGYADQAINHLAIYVKELQAKIKATDRQLERVLEEFEANMVKPNPRSATQFEPFMDWHNFKQIISNLRGKG